MCRKSLWIVAFITPFVLCLSVCYLFVSLVSSTVAWWRSGSFCLVGLPTSTLLSQCVFVVRCEWCSGSALSLLHFKIVCFRGHLLVWGLFFVILNSLHVKVARDLLLIRIFVFELPEGVWIPFCLFVVFVGAVLIKHLVASFLFESVPLLLKFSFKLCFLDRVEWFLWIQRVLGWLPYLFRAPIWHAIA